jgi:hypothetical protein
MEEDEIKIEDPSSIGDIFKTKAVGIKPPAYVWQDLALRIEKELRIPAFKRSSVFKACRDYPRSVIERCLADTKELCKSGEQWRYFFKILTLSHQTEHTELEHDQLQKEIHKTAGETQDPHH